MKKKIYTNLYIYIYIHTKEHSTWKREDWWGIEWNLCE